MSGIFGVYHLDGRAVEPQKLKSMLEVLAHRGADGADLWHQDNVGFGHRMLWTTPESLLEKLPWCDRATDTVISADARIDNREELISLLGLKIPTEKITDSILILKAYQKWGVNCPQKLLGDFAFAIWDDRQRRLFCARDPMGIKPFYYYQSSRVFAFASEIKALFCLPEVKKELNELRIAYQLTGFLEDGEITFYQDIYRLKAAHSLTISDRGKQYRRYWALDPNRRIKLGSHQEYTEAFKELFTESVNCRLRSAFPIGSTLSGGLDSSSITCTARNLLSESGKQLHTFSAIFPNLPESDLKKIDERYYMDAVKTAGGIQAHDIRADLLDPLLDWFWQDEEPILGTNMYIHQGMYDCARQNGVRIFLDGVDGDSTISHGWRYLTNLTYTGRWYRLYKEITATAKNLRISRKLIGKEYCFNPFFDEPFNQIKQRLFPHQNYDELIAPTFAKQTKVYQHIRGLSNEPLFLTAREQHRLGLATGLYPLAMEIADKTATPRSIEPRYPFFDRRLMEFCLAIPLEQKFRQGYPRAILRHAMTDVLPPEIQWRINKAKLGSNLQRNFLTHQRHTIENVIKDRQTIEPYIDMSKLSASYNRYAVENRPQPGDDINLLNAVSLSLWLNRF